MVSGRLETVKITFKQSQVLTFWTFFTWGFRGTFWGPEMKRPKLTTYNHLRALSC